MIKDSRHTSRVEEDKSINGEENTLIQEYSVIQGKVNGSEMKGNTSSSNVLDGIKHSESYEQRVNKLEILEQNINKIKEDNLNGKNNTHFFREFRQRLDEIQLDKIRISANLSQSMLGVAEVSGIPEASTLSHGTLNNSASNKNKQVSKSALIHDEEEQHLAETLRLLQGEVTKLNRDMAPNFSNSVNNTGSVRMNDCAESKMKNFSFSERAYDFTESKHPNQPKSKTIVEQSSLLESKQDFKNSNQSTYFTRPKS